MNPTFELELSLAELNELEKKLLGYGKNFLSNLPQQKAYIQDDYEPTKEDALLEITQTTLGLDDIVSLIDGRVDRVGLNPASGGHLGYIPGGGIPMASWGDFIAALTNRYAGVFYASPGAVRIENALIRWVGKILGYTNGFGGNITSGGSMANLIALSTARTAKNIKARDIEKSVIYLPSQCHHSLTKSLRIIGLEECILRWIEVDAHFRIDVDILEKQIVSDRQAGLNPFLLIANAGSTDVGAVDPLSSLASIAKRENIWLHVDAAYGGFFVLTEKKNTVLEGIHLADSIVLDPHKSLFLPYGTGMVMVKNIEHLLRANHYEAAYMQDAKIEGQEVSPADVSPELSRNFRRMRMWLPLKYHGVAPFVACLNEKLQLSAYFYEKVRQLGFETGPFPDLTVSIFRLNEGENSNETNRQLLQKIHADGRIFISSTEIKGTFWLRAAILSFRTHQQEVDTLLEMLTQVKR